VCFTAENYIPQATNTALLPDPSFNATFTWHYRQFVVENADIYYRHVKNEFPSRYAIFVIFAPFACHPFSCKHCCNCSVLRATKFIDFIRFDHVENFPRFPDNGSTNIFRAFLRMVRSLHARMFFCVPGSLSVSEGLSSLL